MFEILFVGGKGEEAKASSITFATAVEASAVSQYITTETGKKTRIKQIVDDSWRIREAARYTSGEYKSLPEWWVKAPWWTKSKMAKDHYVHFAKDGKRIAFTESAEKGLEDKQAVLDATKYLGKYFNGALPSRDIQSFGLRLDLADYPLHISKAPEDFERVYEEGGKANIGSCMSASRKTFNAQHHPAYAYGAGDLAIAWIEEKGVIKARCVIWPEKKRRSNLYFAADKYRHLLRSHLDALGLDCAGLIGARMLIVPRLKTRPDSTFIMPFLDGVGAVRVGEGKNKGFFVTDVSGAYRPGQNGRIHVAKEYLPK